MEMGEKDEKEELQKRTDEAINSPLEKELSDAEKRRNQSAKSKKKKEVKKE